jgi:hypothetical protein
MSMHIRDFQFFEIFLMGNGWVTQFFSSFLFEYGFVRSNMNILLCYMSLQRMNSFNFNFLKKNKKNYSVPGTKKFILFFFLFPSLLSIIYANKTLILICFVQGFQHRGKFQPLLRNPHPKNPCSKQIPKKKKTKKEPQKLLIEMAYSQEPFVRNRIAKSDCPKSDTFRSVFTLFFLKFNFF